jgi:cytochrome P450
MNETLRLFPTVPINSRRSVKDTTLPRGGGSDGLSPVFVPKDTEVNYSVYATHRNKAIWGPDAEKFIPERWDGRKTGFEYLPFNGGPR